MSMWSHARLRRVTAAALLAALSCQVGVAGQLDFAADGMIKEIDLDLWGEAIVHTPADPLDMAFYPVGMGWSLDRVQKAFGGTIVTTAEHAEVDGFLCYLSGGNRVLYLASEDKVDWIVAEPGNTKHDASYHCTESPDARLSLNDGFPQLGATTAELRAQFDVGLEQGNDREIFFLEEEFESYSSVRTVYYRLRNGVVDGISLAYHEYR
jgi:hypothetical protein